MRSFTKNPSDNSEELRRKVLGLGESSVHKTHYPSLRQRLAELERFRSLIDISSDLLFVVALPSGQILDVSAASCERLGTDRSSLLSRPFSDLVSPAAWEAILAIVEKLRLGLGRHGMMTTELTNADSQRKLPVEIAVQYLQFRNSNVAILAARDITERKRAEDALRRSEAFLDQAQRLTHVGSWALNLSGFFEHWSPELFQIYGLDPAKGAPTLEENLRLVHPQDREFMTRTIDRMLAEASGCDVKKRIVRPDCELRYIRFVAVPVVEGGILTHIVGTAMDVTEQEHLTQELRRREAYLAEAQRLSHTGSFGWTVQSGENTWSEETFKIFECDPAAKAGLELVLQRTHPDDRALVQQTLDRASNDGTDFDYEHRLQMPDGRVKYLHVVARALRDSSGAIEFVGAVMDVTAAKQVEEKIRQNEKELRNVIETIPVMAFTAWPDGLTAFRNRRWREYTGLPVEDTEGFGWRTVIHPEDVERHMEKWRMCSARGEPCEDEARFRRAADGEYRWFLFRAVPLRDEIGRILKWYGVLTDIEDRKRAEQALKQSEAYLAEAQRLSHTGSFAYNPGSGKTLYWSEENFRIWAFDPQQGLPNFDIIAQRIHPEDRDGVVEYSRKAVSEGRDYAVEGRILLPDGTVRHILSSGHPVLGRSGELVQVVGTHVDITERKRAEEKLRQDEMELRQILDAAPQNLAVQGPEGSRLYINQAWLDYFGVTLEEWQNSDPSRFYHPDDWQRMTSEVQSKYLSGSPHETEARLRGKDGKYRWFLIRRNPLRDEQGHLMRWYSAATDIEDRKQAEERLQHENVALREEIDKASMFEEIVGTSPALRAVLSRVSKVAPTDSTVLIIGETGTGKELVARAIHRRSPRSTHAFVSVNCAAIPRDLIASELFGHEKGAFTGAAQQRLGRFELAVGGTIFLDEVGELPIETQIALLRVLQEHEFERVGGTRSIQTDVRVIAATNRDLMAATAAGTFRHDLFYRLNVFPIDVPPLRERKEDIPLLVEYFIDRYARKAGKDIRGVNKKTLDLLLSYLWPGNIRELQNVIERSVILCDTENLSVDESWVLQQPLATESGSSLDLSEKLAAQEKEMIEAALRECKGRVFGPSGAAAKLGLPRSTLESKIRSLRINKNRFKTTDPARDH